MGDSILLLSPSTVPSSRCFSRCAGYVAFVQFNNKTKWRALYLKPSCNDKQRKLKLSTVSSNDSFHLPSPLCKMKTLKLHSVLIQHLAASAILFISLSARACTSQPVLPLHAAVATRWSVQDGVREVEDHIASSVVTDSGGQIAESLGDSYASGDKELNYAFEKWKSRTYALTVPLRIVALRGSIAPSWIKEFINVQGKRLKLQAEFRGSLEEIYSDLSMALKKGSLRTKSVMAADIVTIGDSWLSLAISQGLIEPIANAEDQDWFSSLNEKWKVYLRRNSEGNIDCNGKIWAAPYRWGSMVIAFKKNKFQKHNLGPIEDWADLWRPELAGKISMVDSPREVIGAVLKFMGASCNTSDIDAQVTGGRDATMRNLALLQRQVRLFDSAHYLKAFAAGDVWVAVGWSSDVIPAAKRLSNVAVIVPKSGTSLWADLWAIPAATRFTTNKIGSRVRSPSPLIHQWIEFCLQPARVLPFKLEVIPGASPLEIEDSHTREEIQESFKRKPKLDTNLIGGIPPPEILSRCEFFEPLSKKALTDYQWLAAGMEKGGLGWFKSMMHCIASIFRESNFSPESNQCQCK